MSTPEVNRTPTPVEPCGDKLTEGSRALFLALARDACNWSGCPPLSTKGNVPVTRATTGYATHLKKLGLITTMESDGCSWVSFTKTGRELCTFHGVDVSDFY